MKNPFEIWSHEPTMQREIQGHTIAHMVAHQRATVARLECVLVKQKPMRPAKLFVHKAMERLPVIYPVCQRNGRPRTRSR